jgi:signal transduction histidine kinase
VNKALTGRVLLVLCGHIALGATYFVVGWLGLSLAFEHESISPIWPPTGLALAAVLRFGFRVVPTIALAAFVLNYATGAGVAAFGIALGNSLEAAASAYLIFRVTGGRVDDLFASARKTAWFIVFGVLLGTMVSATIGVTSLCLADTSLWNRYSSLWRIWWLGDSVGALLVAPFLVAWTSGPFRRMSPARIAEMLALAGVTFTVVLFMFGGFDREGRGSSLEPALFLPIYIVSTFRFGIRGFTTAHLVAVESAIWGTLHGFGPFVRADIHLSLMHLQGTVFLTGSTLLLMMALIEQMRVMENRFRTLQSELRQASRLSVMGETAAGLAHEMNQPLGAIANYANGCLMRLRNGGMGREELEHVLEEIRSSSIKAGESIRRLRAFIQDRESQRCLANINAIVRQALEIVRPDAERCHIALEFVADREVPRIVADEIQISHVVVNLLANAIQAIEESRAAERWIRVETSNCEPRHVEIIVLDSGPGVPAGEEARLFDQFYTTRLHGLGMGLAMSRTIAEAHGGSLTLEPGEGKGMRARFRIPAGEVVETE